MVSHCEQKGQTLEVVMPRRKRLSFVNSRSLLASQMKILHLFGASLRQMAGAKTSVGLVFQTAV